LPRKMYDLAWRTALSYRYRRGELVVVEKVLSNKMSTMSPTRMAALAEAFKEPENKSEMEILEEEEEENGWSRVKPTLWVLEKEQKDCYPFTKALEKYWPNDKVRGIDKVDVKNILEGRRIVIEKKALDKILADHQCDLRPAIDIKAAKAKALADSEKMQLAAKEMTSQMRVAAMTASISQAIDALEEETGMTMKKAKKLLDWHTKKSQKTETNAEAQ
jgi:hypothetical protein